MVERERRRLVGISSQCLRPRQKRQRKSSVLKYGEKKFELIISSSLQFQKNTEHSNFSNSVVDVFTQLTQCFEVLQKLECQDDQIWKRYMKRFAKTVVKVLTAYAEVLKNDFPVHVRNEPIACVLMNNIQQTRVQLEKTYVSMGGNDLEPDASQPLTELQSHLNVVLLILSCIQVHLDLSHLTLALLDSKIHDLC